MIRPSPWKRGSAAILTALALVVAGTAGAADPTKLCGTETLAPSPGFQRGALVDLAAEDLAAGRLQAAFDRIAAAYEQSLPPGAAASKQVSVFLRQLRAPLSYDKALWSVGVDEDTAGPLLFEHDPDPGRHVSLPCKPSIPVHYHDMVSIAQTVNTLLAARDAPALQARWTALKRQATDHEDLLRNGLPMWPWELWLNGRRLGRTDAAPLFTTQWVFLRPSVGVEINLRSRERANLEGSLVLEPIGFVKYLDNSRYAEWWGASAIVTATTGQGMGYGALVRYGRYSAGLTLHHSEAPGVANDVHLVFSMDLYDLIEKKRGELPALRAGLKKSVADLLSEVR
ncbi:MAG: hypothetical protein U1F52_18920 [Burkholderiales bacterium]